MALIPKQDYTIEDIYALPDGQRAELIDGVINMMSPPSTKHQEISENLYNKIRSYIDGKKGTCQYSFDDNIPICTFEDLKICISGLL